MTNETPIVSRKLDNDNDWEWTFPIAICDIEYKNDAVDTCIAQIASTVYDFTAAFAVHAVMGYIDFNVALPTYITKDDVIALNRILYASCDAYDVEIVLKDPHMRKQINHTVAAVLYAHHIPREMIKIVKGYCHNFIGDVVYTLRKQ
jgi:hypothetical protein